MPEIRDALTFDDVLLVPNYSEVVPAEIQVGVRLTPRIFLRVPVLSSAMDTVTEGRMAAALAQLGALGVIHKNLTVHQQAEEAAKVKKEAPHSAAASVDASGRLLAAAAVGATGDFLERALALAKAGADAIVVDTAHGHTRRVLEAVRAIKKHLPHLDVIAGNVGTEEGAKVLFAAGSDVVKVGIGPGSICTTRIVSGCGVPQLTAVMDAARAAKKYKRSIIADGGIKFSGDLVKALAGGATAVMAGSMLAGTDEAPGEVLEQHGRRVKSYRGMGSLAAMEKGSKDRYGQEGLALSKLVPEGVEATVAYKGPVAPILEQLLGGLKAGMGYCGAKTVAELQKKARFVRITNAGLKESHVHDVAMAKTAPNYHQE
ncbi:MAG TPA: IMP dehydrogenase [Patescibacteria group bacterium]|nr:IMP dehydrogenase [Patescibacteria group bacterium]